MASVSYTPGGGTALAGDSCWMLIDAAPDSIVVADIWRRISPGPPRLDMLVAGLLQFGFDVLPDFALLLAASDGRQHLLCRGGGRATLVAASGSTPVDGTGLATWLDYPVPPDVTTIVLGQPPAESDLRLPVAAGMFLANRICVSLTDASNPSPPSSWSPAPPATPAEPVPSPQVAEPDPEDRAWEQTQMRSAEDAAIQPAGAGRPGEAALGGQSGLIDSVPGWALPESSQSRSREALPVQADTDPSPPPPSHSAFPETIAISQLPHPAPQSLEPPPAAPVTAISDGGFAGDGALSENTAMTIRRSELRPAMPVPAVQDQIGPTVRALVCMRSHLSPPNSAECRVCGEPLPQQDPVVVPRPPLGVLRLSTGDVIALNQGVVMGRNPRAEFDGDERLHMVKLPSDGDISRTHVKVTLDGWHVLVTDMKSTNGTLVELPGRPPERLRASEPVPIPHGTVVTLAEGIYFRYEVTE